MKLAYNIGCLDALVKLGATVLQKALTPEQKAYMDRLQEVGQHAPQYAEPLSRGTNLAENLRRETTHRATLRRVMGGPAVPFVGGWGEFGGARIPGLPSVMMHLGEAPDLKAALQWEAKMKEHQERLAKARRQVLDKRFAREDLLHQGAPNTATLDRLSQDMKARQLAEHRYNRSLAGQSEPSIMTSATETTGGTAKTVGRPTPHTVPAPATKSAPAELASTAAKKAPRTSRTLGRLGTVLRRFAHV